MLVSCSDSRVGPEQLFARGLGELFIVRNAGNTAASVQSMGSIEYAVGICGGRTRCAAGGRAGPHPVRSGGGGGVGRRKQCFLSRQQGDLVSNAVRENVRRVADRLRTASEPMLLDPQREGRLKVVGAYYNLDTGAVDFFDEPTPIAA